MAEKISQKELKRLGQEIKKILQSWELTDEDKEFIKEMNRIERNCKNPKLPLRDHITLDELRELYGINL